MRFLGHTTGRSCQKEVGFFAKRRKINLGGRIVHWPSFAELLGFPKNAPLLPFFVSNDCEFEFNTARGKVPF